MDIVEIRKTWYIVDNVFDKMPECLKIKRDRHIQCECEERSSTVWEQ